MTGQIPSGSIGQQLREALKAGATPEDAVRKVLGPFGAVLAEAGNDHLVGYARPAVLSEARRLGRQLIRRAEDRSFGAAPASRDRMRLGQIEFHLPDGQVVSWADATAEQHGARIAWLRTYISSVEEDLARHERAAKLLAEHGAAKLSDIPGWEDLIGDDADSEDADDGDASAEAVA
jgi:hypothetical protein